MKTLYQAKTKYHSVEVLEENSIRKLLFGVGFSREQSAINIKDLREHIFDYSLLSMYSLLFIHKPSRVLIIGLGGGIVPREISYYLPKTEIDVIEIDPEVVRIAKEHFYFSETDKLRVHIGDAFVITDEIKEKYDIIIADAFLSNYIPFPLMAIEFLDKLSELTKENAVIAANLCSWHPSFFSQVNTYREVFGENIYKLDGERNEVVTMLYVVRGDLEPISYPGFPYEYKEPEIFEFTEEVKKSKIFSLKSP